MNLWRKLKRRSVYQFEIFNDGSAREWKVHDFYIIQYYEVIKTWNEE